VDEYGCRRTFSCVVGCICAATVQQLTFENLLERFPYLNRQQVARVGRACSSRETAQATAFRAERNRRPAIAFYDGPDFVRFGDRIYGVAGQKR
jgi:hypothetical protein